MVLRRTSLVVLLFSLLLALPAEGARRIAVLDLENQSGGSLKEEFSWIGLNVPETLAGKLSEVPGIQVIERAQWKKLVDELRLSLSDLFNEEKAAQLGEQLGAEVMGLGSFVIFAGSVNVNIRFVDVETGTVLGASSLVSPVDGRLFEAFATLALDAVEVLNRQVIGGEVASLPPGEKIEVPEETREKIEKPATKTFDAYALHGKGREAYDQNRWDEAIALYQQALTLDPDYAEAWQNLGAVLESRGRWDEAEEAGRHALSVFTKRGDEKGTGEVLNNLGIVAGRQERYDEAERLYRESLEIARRLGDEGTVAAALNNRGEVARNRGRFDEAERLYQESLAIERRLGNESGVAGSLCGLGLVAGSRGRYDEAERLHQESLAIKRRIGDEPGVAGSLNNLGLVADRRGRLEEAARLFRESLAIDKKLGNEPDVASTLGNLGVVAAQRGRFDEAERLFQEGLAIARRLGKEPDVSGTLFNLALLANQQGQRGETIRYAREALEISRRIGHPIATEVENLLQELGDR